MKTYFKSLKGRWFTAQHRGSLKDSMETEKSVSCEVALKLIKSGLYRFYSYDDRIDADVYILNFNLEENLGLPCYLHHYEEGDI